MAHVPLLLFGSLFGSLGLLGSWIGLLLDVAVVFAAIALIRAAIAYLMRLYRQ